MLFLDGEQITHYTTHTHTHTQPRRSKLFLDGEQIVDNEGLHGAVEKCATRDLPAGKHKVYIEGFQAPTLPPPQIRRRRAVCVCVRFVSPPAPSSLPPPR